MDIVFLLSVVLTGAEYVEFDFDSSMSLGWEIVDSTIQFTFTCEPGWCGIGFSHSMESTDTIIISWSKDSELSIFDSSSLSKVAASEDTTSSSSKDVTLVSASRTSVGFSVVVSRLLRPNDVRDFQITLEEEFKFAWAYSNGAFPQQYSVFEKGLLKIGETEESSSYGSSEYPVDFRQFGFIMTTLWGILAPIGAIIGRYFKWWKWWYVVHLVIYSVVVVATIISATTVILTVRNVYTDISTLTIYHSRIGYSVASLVLGQGFLGLLVRYLIVHLKDSVMLTNLRILHRILGWSMLLIAFCNIYSGWSILDPSKLYLVVLYELFLVTIVAVLEANHRKLFKLKKTPRKLSEMTHTEALNLKGREIAFCDEYVLDLNSFKFTHPGGHILIKEALGEDVGKYLVGTNTYGAPYRTYLHSKQAFNMVPHLAIGRIPIPPSMFSPAMEDYAPLQWTLTARDLIATNTFLLTLTHPTHKLSSHCLSTDWIGKHFKVTAKIKGKRVTRYYSLFFTDLAQWKNEIGVDNIVEKETGSLQILYKDNGSGTMTKHFTSLELGKPIELTVPYGPGLSVETLKGDYMALVAGTGLVPLLDLLYWMWTNRGSLAFSLTLVTRCRSSTEYYLKEELDHLAEAIPDHFEVFYRDSDLYKVTDEAFAKAIEIAKEEKPERIWLCGPSDFNRSLINKLTTKANYPREHIISF